MRFVETHNFQKAKLTFNVEIPTFPGDLFRNKSKEAMNSGGEKRNTFIYLLTTSPCFQIHVYIL